MKLASWFAVLGCVSVAAVASIASQGCTATVTSGTTPGDDDGQPPPGDDDAGNTTPQEDSGSTPPSACLECEFGQCSGLYEVCVNDTAGCLAIYQCATAPACASDVTGDCVTACINAQGSNAQALYTNLGTCEYQGECNGGTCAAACAPPAGYCSPVVSEDGGGDDGGGSTIDSGGTTVDAGSDDAGTVDSAAPQTCTQCQASACGTQLTNCGTGTQCAAYTQCVLGCATTACTQTCATNSPTGVQASQALGTCTSTSCPVCTQ
jgi:hypothetical protein